MSNLENILVKQVLKKAIADMQIRSANNGMVKHPTGFLSLDRCLEGICDGELMVIASRAGVGKSTLMMNMVVNTLFESEWQRPLIIATGLTSARNYVMNMLSFLARIKRNALQNGVLQQSDWDQLIKASDTISAFPICIDDSIRSLAALEQLVDQARERWHISPIVAIDDIAWLHMRSSVFFSRNAAEVVGRLSDLAKSRQLPVIFTANVLDKSANNPLGRPLLFDVEHIEHYEHLVDKVLLLYREDIHDINSFWMSHAELFIAKNSMGPVHGADGGILLSFEHEMLRFQNRVAT